ncbi:MAG: tRNA (adenosine(37)-N6)-dimethylallyltransferase MiaA [Ignavibacteria bacterium]
MLSITMNYNLVTILGATAVGKTSLAARLAYEFNGEIISADSRQVYRGMDIGTGKDLKDYLVDGHVIPYHLIDIINPTEEYNLFLFLKHFYCAHEQITGNGKLPFLVGGTGLFLNSALCGYTLKEVPGQAGCQLLSSLSTDELKERLIKLNPKLHNTTDLIERERIINAILVAEAEEIEHSVKRIKITPLVIGIDMERDKIKERITFRLKERLRAGMIDEVKSLIDNKVSYEKLKFFGLEYKFAARYLLGELNYNDMQQKLNSAIYNFAKRQMTWFRKMEREGVIIHWIQGGDIDEARKIILNA